MKFIDLYREKYIFTTNIYGLFFVLSFIPDLIGVNEAFIIYPIWSLRVVMAIMMIKYNYKKYVIINLFEALYFYVIILYTFNIFYDFYTLNESAVVTKGRVFNDLIIFIIGILIAITFKYEGLVLSEKSFNSLLLVTSFGLLLALFFSNTVYYQYASYYRYQPNNMINGVIYGQAGAAVSLMCMWGVLNRQDKHYKYLLYILFFLGIISIAKSGARASILALIVTFIYYYYSQKGAIKSIIFYSLAIVMVYFFYSDISLFLEKNNISIFYRLERAVNIGDFSNRDVNYEVAIQEILESPIYGNFYLLKGGLVQGHYPHNYLLEAFMAMGLLGGVPFVILIIVSLTKSYDIMKNNSSSSWIAMLYLQLLIMGMFSTSLYGSQAFWGLLYFVVSYKKISNNS